MLNSAWRVSKLLHSLFVHKRTLGTPSWALSFRACVQAVGGLETHELTTSFFAVYLFDKSHNIFIKNEISKL